MAFQDDIRKARKELKKEEFQEFQQKPDWERNEILANAAEDDELKALHEQLAVEQKRAAEERLAQNSTTKNKEYIRLRALEEGPTTWQKFWWKMWFLVNLLQKSVKWVGKNSPRIFAFAAIMCIFSAGVFTVVTGLWLAGVLLASLLIFLTVIGLNINSLPNTKKGLLPIAGVMLALLTSVCFWRCPTYLHPSDLGVVTNNGEFRRFIYGENWFWLHEPPNFLAGDKLEWTTIDGVYDWNNVHLKHLLRFISAMPKEQKLNFFLDYKYRHSGAQSFLSDDIAFVLNEYPVSCQEKLMSIIHKDVGMRQRATIDFPNIQNREYVDRISALRLKDEDFDDDDALEIMRNASEELALQAFEKIFAGINSALTQRIDFQDLALKSGSPKLAALVLEKIVELKDVQTLIRLAKHTEAVALRALEELRKLDPPSTWNLEIVCDAAREDVLLSAWNSGKFTTKLELIQIIHLSRTLKINQLAYEEFLRQNATPDEICDLIITANGIYAICNTTETILEEAIGHPTLATKHLIRILRDSKYERFKKCAEKVLLKKEE